ncbi:MAG TPA: hypothetical protein V6D14_13590 [Coleofasciculaceae cyanobacterium]
MSNVIRNDSAGRLTQRLMIMTVTGTFLFLWKAEVRDIGVFKFIGTQPASAQILRPQEVSRQVYERLPDFPRENQYVSKETGQVNSDDTLVSRLIRYHLNVKSRPSNYRFDWKLTMAEYIDANALLSESTYPSGNTLEKNPIEGDRAVIQKLNRSQRDALVNVLVSLFNANRATTSTPKPTSAPTPDASQSPPTTPTRRTTTPSLPKPGDAQLLLP